MPMRQAKTIKTRRQPLKYRPGVSAWFGATQTLFNTVAAFYAHVLDAHPAVLDLPAQDALTALERLTHPTADHPQPVMPLSSVATQVPAYVRRAAIHAALGSMRSFHSHLARGHQTLQEKPPTRPSAGEAPKGAGVVCSHGAAGRGALGGHGTA
jgi:putative transposase